MSETVADLVVRRLREWDVELVFAFPGDGISHLLDAFGATAGAPRFVQARHEEMSAMAAVGYAKFSGRVGVCLATSGPGAIHLLNGLYDAKLDHVPLVAIIGATARGAQEVNLQALYADVASMALIELTAAAEVPTAVDRAMRAALAQREPVALIIPARLQAEPYPPPGPGLQPGPPGPARAVVVPPAGEIERAAQVLNAGSKVAMLIGQGARDAAAELREVAEVTGAGVAKALLGKDVLPDELPYVTGSIGLLGTRPSSGLMRDCDTLLIVGSNFPYPQFLPGYGTARGVQIDIDARVIGMRYPTEVNLIGDARETLGALIPLLERKTDRGWRRRIESDVAQWWRTMRSAALTGADPVNPMRTVWELSERAPDDLIVTADSGLPASWYARDLRMRAGMRGSLSGTLAITGCGVPYAIGAKFAHPDRPVVALVGAGAMRLNGLTELITIQRYWSEWTDPRCVICVLHNDLNQVPGEPRTDVSYAVFARELGLGGFDVENATDLGMAWADALSADCPVVLDVHCWEEGR
ncbi:MAG TPA: thiamine pyrophosphate-requiring protein [Actinophytocola sp.]|uniref:thiamine pyrophosphate-requiring protein n=1 Tax=Actinophytocola sp. TaxID=1872138 RepID=UPI002DBF917A|nr:thiamine pyrophosphate-requiring protein [Actinophytocola sp.]HEU5472428.1 thiamine pyrophosphate-requiring protein [Actinophytocola sp.]